MAATGIEIRPLTLADAAAVAAVAGADESAFRGQPSRTQPTDVLAWWERTDLARNSWLYEDAGAPVAVGWFELWGEIGTSVGIVAQGAKNRGFGAALVERTEICAREHDAPKTHTRVLEQDAAAAELFRSRGFSEVRRFYEMSIELAAPPSPFSLPDGLVLDEFREADAQAFHAALIESFHDHWNWYGTPFDEWWKLRRGQQADADGPLWFVVRAGGEIAAVARNEANRTGGGYVGALGVRRAWRGKGLGKALLYRTFGEFWGRGVPRVTLDVDAESPTGATKLYESVGMEIESSIVVFEKALA